MIVLSYPSTIVLWMYCWQDNVFKCHRFHCVYRVLNKGTAHKSSCICSNHFDKNYALLLCTKIIPPVSFTKLSVYIHVTSSYYRNTVVLLAFNLLRTVCKCHQLLYVYSMQVNGAVDKSLLVWSNIFNKKFAIIFFAKVMTSFLENIITYYYVLHCNVVYDLQV